MNMRKNAKIKTATTRFSLSAPTIHILTAGFFCIFPVLLKMLWSLAQTPVLSESGAKYWGKMLEYPIAAFVLMTGGALLSEYIRRKEEKNGK